MAIETRTDVHGFGDKVPAPVGVKRVPTLAQSIGLILARVPLGAYFLLAGISKYRMEGGVSRFVESNMSLATKYLSENFAKIYLTWLPGVEIVLGSMLIVGLGTRVAAFLVSALLVSFIMGYTGIKHETLPFQPNMIYLGAAAALVFCGAGQLSIDGLLFGPRRSVTIAETYTEPLA
jgi:uncharacterized membrane protein YphA (DoxX/SURF4 family)